MLNECRTIRWTRAVALLLLVSGSFCFALGKDYRGRTVTTPTADAAYYYVYLPSLVLDRDLRFENEYEITQNYYDLEPTPMQRPGNVFGIGPAVFQLPAFVVGHAVATMAGDRTDGFSRWETSFSLWTSIPFSIGALLVAARLLRRRAGPGIASFIGPLVAALAGPVYYYAIRQPGMAHPYATFFVAWFVERWDASYDQEGPRSLRTWVVLGLALGAATLARPQLILWGVLLIPAAIDDVRRRDSVPIKRVLIRWSVGAAAAFVAFAPQLIAWKLLYGSWYLVPQGADFMRWDEPAWSETLFSSRNGLFPWAPLYGPMLVGLLLLKKRGRLMVALVGGLMAQALVNGAVWDWWAGGSFGGRRFDSTFIVFAVGAGALLDRSFSLIRAGSTRSSGWKRRVVAGLIVTGLSAGAFVTSAQVQLAKRSSVHWIRESGGGHAAQVWNEGIGGISGWLTSQLAHIISFPARATFAFRYGVDLLAYDRLVGTHYLGEKHPSVTPLPDKVTDVVQLRELGGPRFWGLIPAGNKARMTGQKARILIGLNRRGRIQLTIFVEAGGPLRISWNGETVKETGATIGPLSVEIPSIHRGINRLEIDAPRGTVIGAPELRAAP